MGGMVSGGVSTGQMTGASVMYTQPGGMPAGAPGGAYRGRTFTLVWLSRWKLMPWILCRCGHGHESHDDHLQAHI